MCKSERGRERERERERERVKVYAYVFVCMCACMKEGVCVGTEGREGKRMREKVCKKKMMEGER